MAMELATYLKQEGHGAVTRLAKAIGAHGSDVSDWANKKRPVPVRSAVAIEAFTGGAVSRQELRPDDFWLLWPDLKHLAPKQNHATALANNAQAAINNVAIGV